MRPQSAVRRQAYAPSQATTVPARRHKPDYWIIALCTLLLSIGLIVVYSIGPAIGRAANVSENYFFGRQMLAVALSAVAFIVMATLPIERLKNLRMPLLIAAGIATALALILPVNPNYPAHRWVRLGGFSFQSVELLKFAVLIWLAGLLSARMKSGLMSDFHATFKPLIAAIAAIFFIVAIVQSDLGSAGVMLVMMGVMAMTAGLPMKKILLIGGGVSLVVLLAIVSTPYRRDRFETFLNPTAHCQTTGYQACQALVAVGSGGVAGLGLGSSVQAYGYLPEAANDSVFAVYAEKFGFIGSVILLAIFGALFARMSSIAERVREPFSQLLVVGILAWLSTQALINVGALIGLLPLKGITLPFISYGGTSVVFIAAAMGIVFQVSRFASPSRVRVTNERASHDHSGYGRRVRGAYHPNPGGRARA